MTDEQMRRLIDALQFAQVELMLYLDVHPDDQNARAQWQKNTARLEEMGRQYHASTGKHWPLRQDRNGGTRAWIDEPWPWEHRH